MPFITVAIPTYNRARLLDRCLRSVFASQFDEMEVLVSDNASTDSTQDVLSSFDDPRLRYWRNPTNLGMEQNLLSVVEAAKGEWVFCLTDDDYLIPGAFDRYISMLKSKDEYGVVLSTLSIVQEDETFLRTYQFHPQTTAFPPGMPALLNLVWAAHIYSRITVRRCWLDVAGTQRNIRSLYPQMYFVGAILKDHPGFYVDEPIVAHTSGNEVFWEYTRDFMTSTRIELINDLLPGESWKAERQALVDQLIDEAGTHQMALSWSKSIPEWVRHQRSLLSLKEFKASPRYWKLLISFPFKQIFRLPTRWIKGFKRRALQHFASAKHT